VTEDAVTKFGVLMRHRIQEGETPARKAWLRAIIDRIEVNDGAIRLIGRKDVLEQCVMAGTSATPGVRAIVPEWRSLRESNPSYQIENLVS
jgi:site-specific DNA recombinase